MTNVAKLARCVDRMGRDDLKLPTISDSRRDSESSPEDETDHVVKLKGRYGVVRQLVYYSSGVGAQSSLSIDSQFAGLTGKGVTANILNAYCFICNNFNFASTLDEIVLVGFSRGAFTVRCLANFISKVGLLRRQGLPFLRPLFRLWKRGETTKLNQMADVLTSLHLEGVKIEILAEWDTVSAMGLPLGFWKRELSSVQDDLNKVLEAVKNAFLAFALDEKRPRFKPMLWMNAPKAGTIVKQCAFIGCHSDIGGGEPRCWALYSVTSMDDI
ncbi:hypothetical protein DM02DRAFT_266774 [Periconia macrospinosa]|uniref:T6SS Phospholipase effector Tle1-like catalytic domain-containing protein n=1 Tax=Periconia macrospinosa TaxID=97972 RepID=A0A2V1D3Z7_9PLEO|nr:hypothetical protein DM02DRAFT_266774 [Periconia macrospinosa]